MTLSNQLTILRMVLTPLFVGTLLIPGIVYKYIACSVFFLASLTDLYDGYIARRYGSVSKWGKFLDPLADKILILSALICLAILGYVATWMVIAIAARDILITALRTYAFIKGRPVVTMSVAQLKTASQALAVYFVLGFMLVDISARENTALWSGVDWIQRTQLVDVMMLVVTALTLITGFAYLVQNRAHLRGVAVDVIRLLMQRT